MRRSVHPDEIIAGAHSLSEAKKATVVKGPDAPCHRWDEANGRWVPALEAETFHVMHIGIPFATFFTCRDERAERVAGKVPLFIVCEWHSGSPLPERGAFRSRIEAETDAKVFLSKIDEGTRKAAMASLRQLGRERGQR